jgi:hypothetical protein
LSKINQRIAKYAPYFGIIAAVMIFGSWIGANFLEDRVKGLRDTLSRLSESRDTNKRSFLINVRLAEIYKTVMGSTFLLREEKEKRLNDWRSTRIDEAFRAIESIRIMQSDLQPVSDMADQTSFYVQKINPPQALRTSVEAAVSEANKFKDKLNSIDANLKEEMTQFGNKPGQVFSPQTMTDAQIDSLYAVALKYHRMMDSETTGSFVKVANGLIERQGDLFGYIESELHRQELAAKWAKRLTLFLFALGTVLSIYGKWLEVAYKKPRGEA